jgi:hypothetical protein
MTIVVALVSVLTAAYLIAALATRADWRAGDELGDVKA